MAYRNRLLIRQIRRHLVAGNVDAAAAILSYHAPAVASDHRIRFRLQKQKFIELLRRGTNHDLELAIEHLRSALAPSALDAYPEAYEEFKHVLLALIYNKEDQTSPVATEWSERKRLDLAGLLSSILRAHLHAYDPVFLMTLRYLISIHKLFCSRQGITSPISDLTQRLLFEERDPPATTQDTLLEAPPFDEVDIQALAHAVELTRQDAVDSLRFAKGDVFQAFQNELCRMRMDVSLVDELVHEYCIYRGMVNGPPSLPSGLCSSRDGSSVDIKCSTSRFSDGEASVNNVDNDGALEVSSDTMSTLSSDAEMRSANEIVGYHGDCSTSNTNTETSYRRQRRSSNKSSGSRSRKRWRGRVEELDLLAVASIKTSKLQDACLSPIGSEDELHEQASKSKFSSEKTSGIQDNRYEVILEMMELANKGMVAEVVNEVNTMDPDFFTQNPVLLFQLKQIEFLKLVSAGNHAMALSIANTHLGPLAANNETLMKSLKKTLLALLAPSEDAVTKGVPLPALATSLQVAMSRKFGIEEPQLMKIMRAALYTHTEWYKLQMCKDRFEELLKIDHLKEINTTLNTDISLKVSADNCTHGPSQLTSSSSKTPEEGGSPTHVSSGETTCDENAIIKVMEFLALPRADAIHLLNQYNGNAEAVIQQIFG